MSSGQRRKLIKVAELKNIWADQHQVEGTSLTILELVNFGFAYSSYYILLRSTGFLSHLDDDKVREDILQRPTMFGKKLEFGKELEREPATGEVYYIGSVT